MSESTPPPPSWARRPAATPFARWSADTEAAFLLALRLTGRVRAAAEAIGRSTSTAYVRRRRNPDFAARWDAAVAEQQAEWIAAQGKAVRALAEEPLGDLRQRRDGWSEARRKLFLRALSETGSTADACARARISTTSAYRLRDKCARFAADWQAALDTVAVTVEQAAYERGVLGWEEPIVQGGQVVATRWRYSESLLRAMYLRSRDGAEAAAKAQEARAVPIEEVRASILRKIEAIERARRRAPPAVEGGVAEAERGE